MRNLSSLLLLFSSLLFSSLLFSSLLFSSLLFSSLLFCSAPPPLLYELSAHRRVPHVPSSHVGLGFSSPSLRSVTLNNSITTKKEPVIPNGVRAVRTSASFRVFCGKNLSSLLFSSFAPAPPQTHPRPTPTESPAASPRAPQSMTFAPNPDNVLPHPPSAPPAQAAALRFPPAATP